MADSAGLELENGRDLRAEDSTTSKEGLERSPQDQVNATTNDESSPQTIEAMTGANGVDLQRGVTVTQPH